MVVKQRKYVKDGFIDQYLEGNWKQHSKQKQSPRFDQSQATSSITSFPTVFQEMFEKKHNEGKKS